MISHISKEKNRSNENGLDVYSLWSDIREGNAESMSKLFNFFYAQLFNYGYKIVPNEAFIKDAIQELFLTLWRKRNDINEAYSVKSYLFSSLRRVIFRRLKKHRNSLKRNYTYQVDFFEEVYSTEELMIHFELKKEKKQKLSSALNSLTGRQKESIYLKFYNGLSNEEIAEVMEINMQSVYNHVSKAINKMQEFVNA